MDHIITDLPESIYSPKLSYVVLALIIIYFGQLIEASFSKGRREKIATKQRDLYHQKLNRESLAMEEKDLEQEIEKVESLKSSKDEENENRSNLEESIESDWSDNSSEVIDGNSEESSNNEVERIKQELSEIQEKAEELKLVSEDLDKVEDEVKETFMDDGMELGALLSLKDRIRELELENENLNMRVKSIIFHKEEEQDPEVVKYLREHQDDLTLEVLEKAYETLIELRASEPEKSFTEYIDELKNCHVNYATELAQLKIGKKEVEIKLQLLKRRYEEELSSFQEIHVEHIFKNSGAAEYLERLKERNKIRDDIYNSLQAELKAKTDELTVWKSKFEDAEKQCNVYWQAWKDTQMKKEELDAERRALQERDRRLMNQTLNLSSASSLADNQVPPPPPINVPSVDELLKTAPRQPTYPYNMSPNSSIPPPPPVDVGDILRQARPGNSYAGI